MKTTDLNTRKMNKLLLPLMLFVAFVTTSSAQMEINGTILYGNEWIDYDKSYWKIQVDKDDMYKVTIPEMRAAGIPVGETPMERLQMFYFGNDHPIYRSSAGIGGEDDYILFHGVRNRSGLDQFVYTDDVTVFNPEYSLVNDSSAYFITVADQEVTSGITLTETDLEGNTLNPEPYFLYEEKTLFNQGYYKPVINSSNVQYSTFMESEGFGSVLNSTNTYNIPVSSYYGEGPTSSLDLILGGNKTGHKFEISLNGELVETYETPPTSADFLEAIPMTLPVNSNLMDGNLSVNILATRSEDDKNRIGVSTLTYPRNFDLAGVDKIELILPPSGEERFLALENWSGDAYAFIPTLSRIVKATSDGDNTGLLIPNSSENLKVYLYAEASSSDILAERTYTDFSLVDHDYIIISNKKLMDDGNGRNYVQEYAEYRASDLGGGYDPIVIDADDLYDQFSYGVNRHFIAIRNFNFWADQAWTDIKAEFIIGKSREYQDHRKENQIASNDNFLVPSFGNPGSDMLLATNPEKVQLIFPIGRLAATSYLDVAQYLDKAKDYDQNKFNPQTIEEREWQKRLIHLGGGRGPGEQQSISNSLREMEELAEAPKFGADVRSFYKTSSAATVEIPSDAILELIDGGVTAITFFGHSSAGVFEINLDNVSNYQNKGKYPIMFSLGCYAGNIHTGAKALSEEFVLEPEKGAIAFLASTGSAYIPTLRVFGREYYELMADKMQGETIGDILVSVVDSLNEQTSNQFVTFLQQLTLHGDPAVRTLSYEGPDVTIDNKTPKTEPTFIDTYQDDYSFCFDMVNLGTYTRDSLNISLTHLSPQGEVATDTIIRVEMPGFRKNYCVTFPLTTEINLIGKNKLLVELDIDDELDEYTLPDAELNNTLLQTNGEEGFEFFVLSNTAVPTFPYDFAIINTDKVKLTASTYNGLTTPLDYIIQVDTSGVFDSPYLTEHEVLQARGTVEKEINLDMEAGTVYYWRVSPMPSSTEVGYVWSGSSFVYEPLLSPGYNQSHYHQFIQNDFENMTLNPDRKFYFARNFIEIKIDQRFEESSEVNGKLFLNSVQQSSMYNRSYSPGIGVAVIDTLGNFKQNLLGGSLGADNPQGKDINTFYFKTNDQQGRINLVNFLEDQIDEGDYVFVYPFLNKKNADFKIEEWEGDALVNNGRSIFTTLENQGASLLESFKVTNQMVPYVLIYRHDLGLLQEEMGVDQEDNFEIKESIPSFWFEGSVQSELIGPALSWNKFEWFVDESDKIDRDTFDMTLIGVTATGEETILLDKTMNFETNLDNIDANQYPYLKVRYYAFDNEEVNPIQLLQWRILYDPIPDLHISQEANYTFPDSLQEGDPVKLKYTINNNSPYNMGATTVTYTIVDSDNEKQSVTENIAAIAGETSSEIDFSYSTVSLLGDYQLQMHINEPKSPMEQFYFNNLGFTEFEVYPDGTDPVLDVTFDGIHILDNDIVSAEPIILVELKDENPYLLIQDTQSFSLVLEYPDGTTKTIDKGSPEIVFTPASESGNNYATLEYNPALTQDGIYKLIVKANDATGNVAGKSTYEVSFRVFNEEMVSNVFNYPNPFSTSTQFVFTLTGNEDPGNILIRIMTVTGKVVKEITMAELGNVHVGINKTDYKWDGTDEYGDRLANGVYLYQVITKKLDGSDYKKFNDQTQNNTDWMFKEGFGKMVIMR